MKRQVAAEDSFLRARNRSWLQHFRGERQRPAQAGGREPVGVEQAEARVAVTNKVTRIETARLYGRADLEPVRRRYELEAAFEVLLESGVEGLSLRSVARRAGVSPGAPYHHFRDKGALLTELASDRRHRAGRAFALATAVAATPRARLEALGTAYVRYALEHRAEFKLIFGGLQPYTPTGLPDDVPILNLFREALREADGGLNAAELDTAAITAWSLVHGLAELLIGGPLEGLQGDPTRVAALAGQITLVLKRHERV